ncbi:class I SAM-dependent methyltransferase [Shewanella sp. VB17]|uniref:class I SAM-dependent methyltransferase n=1 Tax=Shewanella sp. VB17 TaxID=2739432 RepID=UPI001566FDEC|nr:class I SAM-dependent methyltransferase [Shewanella sp. VB17]NRD75700.1 class I SAM-dependent methyltransferase [Shewanella sp. VB17]
MSRCPLCECDVLSYFYQDKKRVYLRCLNCQLVTVPNAYFLSVEEEKTTYDQHRNEPDDSRYRHFLGKAVYPLLAQLPAKAVGLDFGCGSGPTISIMAAEAGFFMQNFDLYYHNVPENLACRYDFITMTEVIEHIADPHALLKRLDSLLNDSSILAIMTKWVVARPLFGQWYYKDDPTHICFYALETFEWIALYFGWRLEVIDSDVIFFHKRI